MKVLGNLVLSVCLAVGFAAMGLTGCSDSSSTPPPTTAAGTPPPPVQGISISGRVLAPGTMLARTDPGRRRWWQALLPAEAYAQVPPVLKFVQNGNIFVFQIDDQGNPVGPVLATSDIKVTGRYDVTLPVGVTLGPKLIIQAAPLNSPGPTPVCDPATPGCTALGVTLNRQALVNTNLDITPLSEVLMRSILKRIATTKGSLSDVTTEELKQLTDLIDGAVDANPFLLSGTTPVVVNNILSSLSALLNSALNIVGGPGQTDAPTILTVSIPDGVVGESYKQALVAVGGTGGLTWSLAFDSGPLPTGISLGAGGRLNGQPLGSGSTLLKVQVVAADNPLQPATQSLGLTITLPGEGSRFPITVGTGLTPEYSWPGLPLLALSVSRETAPLVGVWHVIAGRTDVTPPVTQGTVPTEATALVTTETTLTADVQYRVTILRAGGDVGFATFIPQAPPPPPNGSGPDHILAFVGHGTGSAQGDIVSVGPSLRRPATTTFDAAKHMTGFDASNEDPGTAPTIGNMKVDDFSADALISIGRWNSGISGGTYQSAPMFTCTPSQGLHYAVGKPGTPSAGMPTTGVANYIPIATTKPTYHDGSPVIDSTNALSGTILVDFASKKVGLNLTIKMPDRTVTLQTKGGIATPTQSEISYSNTGTAQLFGNNPGDLGRHTVGGFFVGANAERMGVIIRYGINNTQQIDVAAMYEKVVPP